MARRSGFEQVIRAVAREAARQQRVSAATYKRNLREQERGLRETQRMAIRLEKENAKLAKEEAREAKQRYLESRESEANEQNDDALNVLERLNSILADTLKIDDTIRFDSLRITDKAPTLVIPNKLSKTPDKPALEQFIADVDVPSGLAKLVPGSRKRYERAVEAAKDRFRIADEVWTKNEGLRQSEVKKLKENHSKVVSDFEAKKALRDAEVDSFRDSYHEGDPASVMAYCGMVLERSAYPDDFPQKFSVAYGAESKQLVVEYQLPTPEIVPVDVDFRYVKARDEITSKIRKLAEIKSIYADVIAAIALRTLHEIFEADQNELIDVCCFNGFIATVDPATGRDIQPHLISVRTTKSQFAEIDLARVDKSICLKNLGAQVSRNPDEAQAVKPIIEFNMVDPRFVDQNDLLSTLDSSQNLMELNPFEFEQLVANLFAKMGLESKLTRSSKDGGVDCIAYDPRPVIGGKVVIQAKRYRHTVGVSAVRDLYGTMMNEGANKGILVATSGYGPDAFEFSKEKPIELIDGGGLLYLLQEAGINARIIMPEV